MSRQEQVALVTGATSGIGLEAARALIDRGLAVYGTGRDAARVPTEDGIRPLELDVTDDESMVRATKEVLARHGRVDVLVNNAGYGLNGFLEDLPMSEVRRQFETNVFGLLRMTQLVVPSMRAAGGGRIVHVGSVGGIISAPGAGAYHASKFAVEAIADVQRMELRRFGIDVVLIEPTGVHTPFFDKIVATYPGTGPDSVYADQVARHRDTVQRMAAGGPGFLAIPAAKVGAVIAEQATTRRPRTRMLVGGSAKIFARLRRSLPDRIWDRMAGSQFA